MFSWVRPCSKSCISVDWAVCACPYMLWLFYSASHNRCCFSSYRLFLCLCVSCGTSSKSVLMNFSSLGRCPKLRLTSDWTYLNNWWPMNAVHRRARHVEMSAYSWRNGIHSFREFVERPVKKPNERCSQPRQYRLYLSNVYNICALFIDSWCISVGSLFQV